jgi:hypothetical protein
VRDRRRPRRAWRPAAPAWVSERPTRRRVPAGSRGRDRRGRCASARRRRRR